MKVFVINCHGEPLMPCNPSKARKLLKQGKAKIVGYKPFTIQLLYGSYGYKQPIRIGVDTGAKHIGIAVVSESRVLIKGEVELRSDIKSNIDTRRALRRSRRSRKMRHRKCRFLNRKRPQGWLPPSLQSRINNTFMWIDKILKLLPNPELHIEVGKFDVAKMINPDIQGVDYQHGQTYGYYDTRYFVFDRDHYTCQVCGKKNKIFNTHHIIFKSCGGTDRADNLITVCTDCHTDENHQPGHILYEWMMSDKKPKLYKEPPFMNSLRIRVFQKYPDAVITYGSETTPHRKELGLEKTHYNDAIAITGAENITYNSNHIFYIKQIRKKKRSLHESIPRKGRKQKNTNQKRNSKNTTSYKNYHLGDKVKYSGYAGYISGFTGSNVYIKDADGKYITSPTKNYKQISCSKVRQICYNDNWVFFEKVI